MHVPVAVHYVDEFFRFFQICYLYEHFSECISLCKKFAENLILKDGKNKAMYLMGKANFHVYQKKKFQLKKQSQAELQHTQEYQELHKECYQMAKSVVGLLGAALDNGFLVLCPEELKMLDMAMIDYIIEAKGDCGRCLLCFQKQKLRKSHYFPRAILETLSRGSSKPLDQKIFRCGPDYYGASKSVRELYYLMFCSRCENLFSNHGETQFNPQFLLKIYDESNPHQPTALQDIEYGKWLYQFCVGVIFRGLAVRNSCSDMFVNSERVYHLFHKCRRLLCFINPTQNFPQVKTSPLEDVKVAILVNPSEVLDQPSLSSVLTSQVINYINIQSALDDDVISRPHWLHAFVVHFGVINVLVSIEPSELNVSSEFIINPSGGHFTVPADVDRGMKLPKGIWKAFELEAVQSDMDIIQLPDRVAREFEIKKIQQPSELHQTLFPTIKSEIKAAETLLTRVMPSSLPEAIKISNFLPDQFIIRPPSAPTSVFLPTGHSILVHRSYNLGKDTGDTLFLAVGSDKAYSLDKPYVLYHHYEPGLQLHYGIFVSAITLEAQESLQDRKPKTILKGTDFDVVENFRRICHIKLKETLGEKGIANCMSLLKRIQGHSCTQK
jgi:hypothetical protein